VCSSAPLSHEAGPTLGPAFAEQPRPLLLVGPPRPPVGEFVDEQRPPQPPRIIGDLGTVRGDTTGVEDAAYLVGAGAGSFGHVGPQPSQFGGSTAAQHRPGAGGRGGGEGTRAPVPGVQGGGDEGGTPRSEGGRGEHR